MSEMKTNKEKASYCIGLQTGKNIRQQFQEIDLPLVLDGFKDAFSDKEPKLNPEEIRTVLESIRRQMEAQERQYIAKLAEDNKKQGETFLAENKKKEGVVSLPSGLQYKVLVKGSGSTPTLMDVVSVHYRGRFLDGQIFDSSYERGEPQTFPVNRVIPGWAEALQKMKVGDKWEIFVPSYLAYGEMGFGPQIAPNTTLRFEMELLAVNP